MKRIFLVLSLCASLFCFSDETATLDDIELQLTQIQTLLTELETASLKGDVSSFSNTLARLKISASNFRITLYSVNQNGTVTSTTSGLPDTLHVYDAANHVQLRYLTQATAYILANINSLNSSLGQYFPSVLSLLSSFSSDLSSIYYTLQSCASALSRLVDSVDFIENYTMRILEFLSSQNFATNSLGQLVIDGQYPSWFKDGDGLNVAISNWGSMPDINVDLSSFEFPDNPFKPWIHDYIPLINDPGLAWLSWSSYTDGSLSETVRSPSSILTGDFFTDVIRVSNYQLEQGQDVIKSLHLIVSNLYANSSQEEALSNEVASTVTDSIDSLDSLKEAQPTSIFAFSTTVENGGSIFQRALPFSRDIVHPSVRPQFVEFSIPGFGDNDTSSTISINVQQHSNLIENIRNAFGFVYWSLLALSVIWAFSQFRRISNFVFNFTFKCIQK